MAYVGLAKPIVSKLDENAGTPKYTEGAACGKAIGIDITPQYAEGSLYGDDVQCEYDKEFKYADITLNTTTIPVAMQTVMFGHTATEENVKFNSNDQNDYVGTGFYVSEKIDGKRKYTAIWLYKVKFSEPSESYKTKGDNIEYQTPSITGRAMPLENGDWKETEIFETATQALEWINEKAGISELI